MEMISVNVLKNLLSISLFQNKKLRHKILLGFLLMPFLVQEPTWQLSLVSWKSCQGDTTVTYNYLDFQSCFPWPLILPQ